MIQTYGMKCTFHWVVRSNEGHPNAHCGEYLFGREIPAPFATSCMVGREDKRTKNRTMLRTLKSNAAADYQGPVKIELFKGAGQLFEKFQSSQKF